MKKVEIRPEGSGEKEPSPDGPALGVRRYHALVQDALTLRKLAPTIELQLDWQLFAHEAHAEADRLVRSAELEQLREVYVTLLQRHLELAEALVAGSQDIIDQQRSLVEQTEAAGGETQAARNLLTCFQDAHRGLITKRDSLRRELSH
jgi:hypothetical protein